MKKTALLLTAGLAWLAAAAQPPHAERNREWHEQIQARKAAYFAAKLELTTDEAQAFFPLYNEFWQKRDKLFMERHNILRKIQRDKIDDKKAQQIAQRIVENELEGAALLREYNELFIKVLPPQKLLKYYAAEESFKMELINDLRKQEKGKKE